MNILSLIRSIELPSNILEGTRLLDIGCDDGEFSVAMGKAAKTTNLYGVEIVASQVAIARDNGLIVNQADLEKSLPYDHSILI